MGTDQWEQLEQWSRWDYLCQLVTPIVHHRGQAPLARPGIPALMVAGHHPASSSEVRQHLLNHQSVPDGWLHPDVLDYIVKHHLYASL
jgi:nicotinic acid mononucleotide adenylyltransferase